MVYPPKVEPFRLKAFVIGYTCDLPARAAVQNFVQFNGYFGCSFCEQPGKSVSTGTSGGHVHVFPYQRHSPTEPLRTTKSTVLHAAAAIQQKTVVSETIL